MLCQTLNKADPNSKGMSGACQALLEYELCTFEILSFVSVGHRFIMGPKSITVIGVTSYSDNQNGFNSSVYIYSKMHISFSLRGQRERICFHTRREQFIHTKHEKNRYYGVHVIFETYIFVDYILFDTLRIDRFWEEEGSGANDSHEGISGHKCLSRDVQTFLEENRRESWRDVRVHVGKNLSELRETEDSLLEVVGFVLAEGHSGGKRQFIVPHRH